MYNKGLCIHKLIYKVTGILMLAFLLISQWAVMPSFSAIKNGQTIKVGYFAFDGYHNQDEEGNRSGYGYEYLQYMARYTGWNYEYIGYDKSWNEAQKMLEDGRIDMLTSAQKTKEREKIFDFSDNPIGYSSTIFTIKAGNDKYTIDNFATFNGIRVGMIEGNSRNEEFAAFAKKKGFTYESVMFEDTKELVDNLQKEKIDAIVTSSLRVTNNEWVVSEFGFSPYYVCVKKGNQELLNQVNDAIGKINQNTPGLQNELEDKYYSTDTGERIAFTEEERRYMETLKNSGKTLQLLINPDRKPLSYYENGEMKGILVEHAKKIFEYVIFPMRLFRYTIARNMTSIGISIKQIYVWICVGPMSILWTQKVELFLSA